MLITTLLTILFLLLYTGTRTYCSWRIRKLREGGYFILPYSSLARRIGIDPSLSDAPMHLISLLLLNEDDKFLTHHGINAPEMIRSLRKTLFSGKLKGGSSITQQTAKCLFLWKFHPILRKIPEIISTRLLEKNFTKLEILSVYLQAARLGPGIHGLRNAARAYFSKHPSALTVAESAALVSLFRAPMRVGRGLVNNAPDYEAVFSYGYAYEKILLYRRLCVILPENDTSQLLHNPEFLQRVAHACEDITTENDCIAAATKDLEKLPAALAQIHAHFLLPPPVVYDALSADDALLVRLALNSSHIPVSETDTLLSQADTNLVIQNAERTEVLQLMDHFPPQIFHQSQLPQAVNQRRQRLSDQHRRYLPVLADITSELRTRRIEILLTAGFDFAIRFYQSPELRGVEDTILITQEPCREQLFTILKNAGFTHTSQSKIEIQLPPFFPETESLFHHQTTGGSLTVWGATSRQFLDLQRNAAELSASPDITYAGPGRFDSLRLLCSRPLNSLRCIADMHRILSASPNQEVEAWVALARQQGWERRLLLVFAFTMIFSYYSPPASIEKQLVKLLSGRNPVIPLTQIRILSGPSHPYDLIFERVSNLLLTENWGMRWNLIRQLLHTVRTAPPAATR